MGGNPSIENVIFQFFLSYYNTLAYDLEGETKSVSDRIQPVLDFI